MKKTIAIGLLLLTAACSQPATEIKPDPVVQKISVQSTAPDAPGLPPQVERMNNNTGYPVGSIVVDNSDLKLYFIESEDTAIAYPVGVGSEARDWTGTEVISRKTWWPSWTPTAAMIARAPGTYAKYANGMPGGPSNPLGARALYLGDTYYRIHGTPDAGRIGNRASNGCINMYQSHVIDLYERVAVGAKVYVIQ